MRLCVARVLRSPVEGSHIDRCRLTPKNRRKDKSHVISSAPSTPTDSFGKARAIATSWKHDSLHSRITPINFSVSHPCQDSQGFGDQAISARLFLTGSHLARHTVSLSLRMNSSSSIPSVAQDLLKAQIWCSQNDGSAGNVPLARLVSEKSNRRDFYTPTYSCSLPVCSPDVLINKISHPSELIHTNGSCLFA
ncbi:hypothetical protein ARMGADRAFT_595230 [Armillaria gallica]|uniref:Uncharacterized protein n=1 Tax=Armillaria gallica TaxID=47427 RepID=A0A2H3CU96_ARMGA|nr:hypothetical protein ARMGADRAFT_595230 [Armillaria gallica]